MNLFEGWLQHRIPVVFGVMSYNRETFLLVEEVGEFLAIFTSELLRPLLS